MVKVDSTDNCRVVWRLPPPPVGTSRAGTSNVVQSIANHSESSEGTGWEYEVKWEGWNQKDNTWELEGTMAKANVMVKKYWKEIGGRPKAKRKKKQKAWETGFSFWMVGRHRDGMFVFGSGCFVSLGSFSKMIGKGCDVGGRLWSF